MRDNPEKQLCRKLLHIRLQITSRSKTISNTQAYLLQWSSCGGALAIPASSGCDIFCTVKASPSNHLQHTQSFVEITSGSGWIPWLVK